MRWFIVVLINVLIINHFASHANAQTQSEASALHAKLSQTVEISQGFVAHFSVARGKQTISGSVKAKRGNKFIMNFWERIVTCNGKKVWNYTPGNKTVVVGKYDDSKQQVNLESLFFSILQQYLPTGLSRKLQSNGGRYDVLRLTPKNSASIINDILAVEIYLKPNTDKIQKIGAQLNGQTALYNLSNLKFLSKINDSEFEFIVPKGVEIVDMR